MADVEVIFPEKKIGIKPFALVNLAITIFTALFAAVATMMRGDIDLSGAFTAMSLVLTRCFQVRALLLTAASLQLLDSLSSAT